MTGLPAKPLLIARVLILERKVGLTKFFLWKKLIISTPKDSLNLTTLNRSLGSMTILTEFFRRNIV